MRVAERQLRILLIEKPDSHMTGLRRYQEALGRGLEKAGWAVEVILPPPPFGRQMSALGRYIGLDPLTFFASYPVSMDRRGADVYHMTNEGLATLLALHKIQPGVVTVHGLLPYLLRKKGGRNLYSHRAHRWFDELAVHGLRRAQAVIAVSHFLRDELIRHAGIAGERIHVIHEAVDHAAFFPQAAPVEIRQRYGFDDEHRYVLYVGSEQPEKNFATLLKAFAALRGQVAGVKLVKVGQPEFEAEREAALAFLGQAGMESDVIFLGHLGDDLPTVYNACDLFVYPSRFEGFGLPPLEAMACGIPVVCSNAGALPEVVGDAAWMVDPMDEDGLAGAMRDMLLDEGLRRRYVAHGLENARRFSWDEMAKSTIRVYEGVLSRSQEGHSHV